VEILSMSEKQVLSLLEEQGACPLGLNSFRESTCTMREYYEEYIETDWILWLADEFDVPGRRWECIFKDLPLLARSDAGEERDFLVAEFPFDTVLKAMHTFALKHNLLDRL